jgi:hypothetical protein
MPENDARHDRLAACAGIGFAALLLIPVIMILLGY